MPVYTKEAIRNAKESFHNLGYKNRETELAGRKFSFFEIPRERNPALPCFAVVLAGRKGEDYVIGVSNSVDEAFMPLWAFHEYVEVVEPGADNRIRCIEALRQEIDASRTILAPHRFPEYIRARKKFFENLISYVSAREGHYHQSALPEFRESLEHLVLVETGL